MNEPKPGNTPEEAEAIRLEAKAAGKRADALMLKHAIDSATVNMALPEAERMKPGKLSIMICQYGSVLEGYLIKLTEAVAEHTRCKAIYHGAGKAIPVKNREWFREQFPQGVRATVYGFEGDLAYFEVLFTTLLLHLVSGLEPKPDRSLSDGQNAYRLHMAGLTWADICNVYAPLGHPHGQVIKGRLPKGTRYEGIYWRNQCWKESARLGEPRISVRSRTNYQINFARAYVTKIWQRMMDERNARQAGTGLVLRDQWKLVMDQVASDFPDMETLKIKKEVKFNLDAYSRGTEHGARADLGTGNVGGASRMELPDIPVHLRKTEGEMWCGIEDSDLDDSARSTRDIDEATCEKCTELFNQKGIES